MRIRKGSYVVALLLLFFLGGCAPVEEKESTVFIDIPGYADGMEMVLEHGGNSYCRAGVNLAETGLWDEAEKNWFLSLRMYRKDPAACNNLGVTFERRGQFRHALDAYKNAMLLDSDSERYRENIRRVREILNAASPAPDGTN